MLTQLVECSQKAYKENGGTGFLIGQHPVAHSCLDEVNHVNLRGKLLLASEMLIAFIAMCQIVQLGASLGMQPAPC